jgi:hypothetical protein
MAHRPTNGVQPVMDGAGLTEPPDAKQDALQIHTSLQNEQVSEKVRTAISRTAISRDSDSSRGITTGLCDDPNKTCGPVWFRTNESHDQASFFCKSR